MPITLMNEKRFALKENHKDTKNEPKIHVSMVAKSIYVEAQKEREKNV